MKLINIIFISLLFIQGINAKENLNETLYIHDGALKLESTLPPPPSSDSMQVQIELDTIKRIMAKLTNDQKELARKDALTQNVSFFSDTLTGFDIEKLPKTKFLFDSVKYNASYFSNMFKNNFMKKRPYQEDQEIKVCVSPQPSSLNRTYPSGHTTMGYAMGLILAELIPEKSKEIMLRTRLYGENRVNCGAHYPSDVAAGQVLGTLVAFELLKNNEFKALFLASKVELLKSGLTYAN